MAKATGKKKAALHLCKKEKGRKQVNIAQATDVLNRQIDHASKAFIIKRNEKGELVSAGMRKQKVCYGSLIFLQGLEKAKARFKAKEKSRTK